VKTVRHGRRFNIARRLKLNNAHLPTFESFYGGIVHVLASYISFRGDRDYRRRLVADLQEETYETDSSYSSSSILDRLNEILHHHAHAPYALVT